MLSLLSVSLYRCLQENPGLLCLRCGKMSKACTGKQVRRERETGTETERQRERQKEITNCIAFSLYSCYSSKTSKEFLHTCVDMLEKPESRSQFLIPGVSSVISLFAFHLLSCALTLISLFSSSIMVAWGISSLKLRLFHLFLAIKPCYTWVYSCTMQV